MTSAQAKLISCGPGQTFSLQFTCTGPSCIDLTSIPTISCTDDGSTFTCTNGVTCPGPSNYTADFNMTQQDTAVSQTQKILLPDLCQEIDLTSDGTAAGTNASLINTGTCNGNSSASNISTSTGTYTTLSQQNSASGPSTVFSGTTSVVSGYPTAVGSSSTGSAGGNLLPGNSSTSTVTSPTSTVSVVQTSSIATSFRRRKKGNFGFVLLLLFSIFVGGVLASASDTRSLTDLTIILERDFPGAVTLPNDNNTQFDLARRELSEDLKDFLNLLSEYMANKISGGFASNLVAELYQTVCLHASSVIVSEALGIDLVEACTTVVYTTNLVAAPELEFLSYFGAGVACNLLVSLFMPEVGALTNVVCQLPGSCNADLSIDPKNCGQCGNVCSTGVCVNSACTTPTTPSSPTGIADFTVMSLHSGSPIMNNGVVARGERFYLSGDTTTDCPFLPQIDCSVYDNVTAFSFSQGQLAMKADVPGGQLVYLMSTGELGFTQAHSAAIPDGADTSSFTYDSSGTSSANMGRLGTTAFGANGFMACNGPQWQVFANIPGNDATNCLGFDAATTEGSFTGAWDYI